MRLATVLLLALLLTGCASVPDLVRALAADPASACVEVKAMLYGHIRYCRTATPGAAALGISGDGMVLRHQGGPR